MWVNAGDPSAPVNLWDDRGAIADLAFFQKGAGKGRADQGSHRQPAPWQYVAARVQHGHAGRKSRAGGRTVDLAGLECASRAGFQTIEAVIRRAGEKAERDVPPVRVCRMIKSQLFVRGVVGPDTQLGDVMRFILWSVQNLAPAAWAGITGMDLKERTSDVLHQAQGIINRGVGIAGADSVADAEQLECALRVLHDLL